MTYGSKRIVSWPYNKHYPVMYSGLFYHNCQWETCNQTKCAFIWCHSCALCRRRHLLYKFQLFSLTEVRLKVCVALLFWPEEFWNQMKTAVLCLLPCLFYLCLLCIVVSNTYCLYKYHDGCPIRGRNCLPFAST